MVLDFRDLNDKTVFIKSKCIQLIVIKTAFSTPYGHYEFDRMPFGLKNAPATFQRLMDLVLTGMQEHAIKFEKLIKRLREANLKLQPDKCEFLRKEVTYLGHIIGESGVRPDPKKIEAVQNFPIPKSAKNIKQFLGLAGYYRRFIQGFSKIAKPLTNLLKKDIDFKWGDKEQESFDILRNALCHEPILQYPDFTKPFLLTTDASGTAIGAILSQGQIGKDQPISYASRVLNKAEKNYSTIEKELLAIVYAVQHFRPYLYGKKFKLITDHKPLTWLHKLKDPTSRLARWRIKLTEYDYEIIYKPGKINANADALSRNPVTNIFPIHPSFDEIEECPEDDEARQRNANPKPLPVSPRRGMMMEEPEPVVTGMQTRNAEKSEGESIPFTKKELEEPPFIEHIVHAEIHNNPINQINNNESLEIHNNSIDQININESLEIQNNPINQINNNESLETYNNLIDQININESTPLESSNIINNTQNETFEIETSLENINNDDMNSLINHTKIAEERTNDDNSKDDQEDQVTDDDDSEEEEEVERSEEERDSDSEEDIDTTFNELTNTDETLDRTEKQIITRGQKHNEDDPDEDDNDNPNNHPASQHSTNIWNHRVRLRNFNVTTISLLEIEECNIPLMEPHVEETNIQLLQLAKFDTIHEQPVNIQMEIV
ncbi:uncharacterized protein [Temnothorax longispinosus]|uniref:uncharacterized protein n=1 Tax=Temnothorax longispinosus TaxID=300112 RepID=UPI003A997A98